VEVLLKTPALHHHPLAILLPQQQLTSNNLRFDDDWPNVATQGS
jgi:hypothetical protein